MTLWKHKHSDSYAEGETWPSPESEWEEAGAEDEEVYHMEKSLIAIEAKYAAKFVALRDRLNTVLMVDGTVETAKRAALAAEWQALQDARDAEIMLLLGGA